MTDIQYEYEEKLGRINDLVVASVVDNLQACVNDFAQFYPESINIRISRKNLDVYKNQVLEIFNDGLNVFKNGISSIKFTYRYAHSIEYVKIPYMFNLHTIKKQEYSREYRKIIIDTITSIIDGINKKLKFVKDEKKLNIERFEEYFKINKALSDFMTELVSLEKKIKTDLIKKRQMKIKNNLEIAIDAWSQMDKKIG
ncbi:hypothetical protein C0W96_09955 [Photobacterium kishitanii]|uniref:hypothetical protein n=1 Tax=Photobacterium kishitanii TaxID=318456 RepID=UPI000D15809C|nr:hypothetical protein [Photobacterium kishitanii]PSV05977.1 hypothetical protein C0W96_09955 [Photobacterium kishitanii]PSV74831.1 hypothetical protein C0W29_13960 [Photobacterium kishitanii]